MSVNSSIDNLVARQPSTINTSSPEYIKNHAEWQEILETLYERLDESTNEGKKSSLKLHRSRGQLTGKLYQLPLFLTF